MLKHTSYSGRRGTDEQRLAFQRWVSDSWAITRPSGSGMVYPNYPEPDRPPLDPAYHGANSSRLQQIREQYDPNGRFRLAVVSGGARTGTRKRC